MRFCFILLAGGNSSRFKSNIPKQYNKIAGKTLIDISINKIRTFKEITKIVLVYNKEHKKYLKKINLKDVKLIVGGRNRNNSTLKALSFLKKQNIKSKVLIHDAARPNFSKKLIKNIIINSIQNRAVVPVLKIQDALKERQKKKFLILKEIIFF